MEAQGFASASAAADELRGLLEGSKRVGTLKAAESETLPAAFGSSLPVVGAVSSQASAPRRSHGLLSLRTRSPRARRG